MLYPTYLRAFPSMDMLQEYSSDYKLVDYILVLFYFWGIDTMFLLML